MSMIGGASIQRKGKFYIVTLLMQKAGGKEYGQIYGTYINEQEALVHCRRMNRIGSCGVCKRARDCVCGK